MFDRKHRFALLLVICLSLVSGAHVVRRYEPYTYTYGDPGWMVSTVISIVDDRDLDLRNQLKNNPDQAADQTSQGKDGQWYPLHEILMPFLTVPFYLVFGINGCLVFNVLVSILLMISIYYLCARHVDYLCAFAATILTAFTTLFLDYTYCYSLDVFGTLLLLLAYWCAVSGKFILTGLVWGLAIFSRLANVVTLAGVIPFLVLVGASGRREEGATPVVHLAHRVRPLLLSVAGGLPVGLCILAANWTMFGSPFATSYDRWQHFVQGKPVISSQRGAFSCSFIDRLPKVLADPQSGLLIGGPLILVAIAFGSCLFWNKARHEAVMSGLISIALLVFFTKYCNAAPGAPGNRYLMPIVALSSIPLSIALNKWTGPPSEPP